MKGRRLIKELALSRANEHITEHMGYKLIQYTDSMAGMTFYNAEVYNSEGRMETHATTRKIMNPTESMEYIEKHIELMKRIRKGDL